jgi:hypothetical protein
MFKALLSLSVIAALSLSVHAHGYVQDIVSGSTHYTGYLPYQDPYYNPVPQRIVRPIPGNGMSCPSISRYKTSEFDKIIYQVQ